MTIRYNKTSKELSFKALCWNFQMTFYEIFHKILIRKQEEKILAPLCSYPAVLKV